MQYILQTATDDSVESLCLLFQNVFHKPIQPSAWRWKYQDPAAAGHANVILRDENGRAIGHAGAVINRGMVDGKAVPIAQICDVMLAKQARGQAGPAGAYAAFMSELFSHLRARIPQGLYYGFPGKRPFLLGARLGFYRGTGSIREWRYPVAALSYSPRPWRRLEELDWNDARLDRLWYKRCPRHRGIVTLDRRYLGWRYARNPFHAYRLFGVRSGLRLIGWVVVAQDGDTLRCVERLLDDGHWLLVLSLLAPYAQTIGAHQLAWWAPDEAPRPAQATSVDTGLEGTVVTLSSPEFSSITPFWQPGDVDIY
jgi:hypothetical protein